MSRKWFDNRVPSNEMLSKDSTLELYAKKSVDNYIKYFNSYEIDLAADVILSLAINTNLYLNEKQPWTLIKDENNIPLVRNIIYNVLESTRIVGLLLLPILPNLSSKIDQQLGLLYNEKESWKKQLDWGKLIHESILPAPNPVIEKLEYE